MWPAPTIAAQEAAIGLGIVALAFVLLVPGGANAAELFGHVIAVSDGDTLTLLDGERRQHKVRLSGIDAPEKRQPYGERAKQHLAALAHGKAVMVVWTKHDRYGRIVGRVMLSKCTASECVYATDAGLEQLKAGLAWHYTQYAKEQPPAERLRYEQFERRARAEREGLWKEPEPVPPWQFRKPLA